MNWTTGIMIPGRDRDFFSSHRVQAGSEAHPASYPMGTTRGTFTGGKAAAQWR